MYDIIKFMISCMILPIHDTMYDIMYDIINLYDINHIIPDIAMSTLKFYSLQPPILSRHSVLIQSTTTLKFLNRTYKWISTRSVTFQTKAL